MRAIVLAITSCVAAAFVPSKSFVRHGDGTRFPHNARYQTATRSVVDPHIFHDLPSHAESIQHALTSILLSGDLATDAVMDPATAALNAATDANSATAATAATATAAISSQAGTAAAAAATDASSSGGNGWFGFLAEPIEFLLGVFHSAFVAIGLQENAWGASIIGMTIIIKLLTYPLTKTQLESTNKMQAIQPTIKEIQAKYGSNQDVMNQKVAEIYQANEVNPLAGCIPSLVQIPIFIGLYRALLSLAKENQLNEPFLWLPSLEGPTYGADPASAGNWIFQGWVDGIPSLGWDDTLAFLSIPLILVVSQFISMEIMQPSDPEQRQQQPIFLKALPLMVGWFSVNVPSALGLYWLTNNIFTTAISMQIRGSMGTPEFVSPASSSGANTAAREASNIFTPSSMRERPSGFGSSMGATLDSPTIASDGVNPITPIDAEVVAREVSDGVFEEDDEAEEEEVEEPDVKPSAPSKKRGGKKKKGKK